MGSFIPIDSIYIDLTNSSGKRDAASKSENFSIRGYVSEIRQKGWKNCWPFPIDESQEQSSRPPLDVPKQKCQCCQNCPQESAAKVVDKDDRTDLDSCSIRCGYDTNCSNAVPKSAIQQNPMPNTVERRDIDLNTSLCCASDFLPFSNEEAKKAGVVLSETTVKTGLEDNLNHQITSVSSPEISPGLIQEAHTTKRGCEGNKVYEVELASNHKCMDKSSAEVCNGGRCSSDNQFQEELIKACNVLGNSPFGIKANNTTNHTTRHPPLDSLAHNHTVPSGSAHLDEHDFQGRHLEKFTALSRRRPRKVRLMTDLLSKNGDPKIDQIIGGGSPSDRTSEASQACSILPGKESIKGAFTLTNKCQSGKRKFLWDEARSPEDKCAQGVEAKVPKGDATKYKDVMAGIGLQDATKGYWSKSEIERNYIMGMKSRKCQVIDNHLIPEPHQGQQRVNEDTVDIEDKACAAKTLCSRFAPGVFTEKGMDKFPFRAPRIEGELSLSKGKGKIMQTEGEVGSLSCQKNYTPEENSFAYSGKKIIPDTPVTNPVPLAQGALNVKGVEEGLQLSLNSHLAAQVYNKKCIHQIENQLPLTLPLQEGTSDVHQKLRKDNETNVFGGPSIPSKHIPNAISRKGVCFEETTGARNNEKTGKAMEQLGVRKRYSGKTAVPENGTLDGIPMDIVELLAKIQYERCLPDVENRSSILDKSTIKRKTQMTVGGSTVYVKDDLSLLNEGQKKKHNGAHKKSSMAKRGDNVKPSKRKPVHYSSPFDGKNLGLSNVCPPQSPFPQVSPGHLSSAWNSKFNGRIEERGSFDATLQANGGCSLHKTILQQDDEASRIWASLTSNHVSLGYDVPKKVVFQPTNSNLDITSPQSGALNKQSMRRDIDLNCTNLHVAGSEMLNSNIGPGTFGRMNGGYPFPEKRNGMESHQNLRGSVDMYSNEAIPAMHLLSLMDAGKQSRSHFNEGVTAQMLRRPSYHGDCSTKLEIGVSKTRQSPDYYIRSYLSDKSRGCILGSPTLVASSSTRHDMKFERATGSFAVKNSIKFGKKEKAKSSNSEMQIGQFSWPHRETGTPLQRKSHVHGTHETMLPMRVTLGVSCTVNRNPADFTIPE